MNHCNSLHNESIIRRSAVLHCVDAQEQCDIASAFAASFTLWCNHCAWTYRVRDVDASGSEHPSLVADVPFDLWDCQTEASAAIIDAVRSGDDVVVRKSRDMGASWLMCGIAVWGWMFHSWQSLFVSRVEDLVDRSGDPDCLFWKIDYLLQAQPRWLLPCDHSQLVKGGDLRQHLVVRNPVSSATITGQASTAHIGRGGRRTFVMFDEFASLDDAGNAWRSSADCTSSRIAVSTPIGAGTEYERLVLNARSSRSPRLVELLYTQHPEKSRGAEQRVDDDGLVTGIVGSTYTWSPWLAQQLLRRDRIDLAQNVFADSVQSGESFFASASIDKHAHNVRVPERGEIVRGEFVRSDAGRWRIFAPPCKESRPSCVMFADPAYGTGSANSAVCVMDAVNCEMIAEFVDPTIAPHNLALEMMAAGRSVFRGNGDRAAMCGWETNGAGAAMHHDFEQARYFSVYRQRQVGTDHERVTHRVGWTSTRRAKRTLLSDLSRELTQGGVVIRSAEALEEMRRYVVLDDGAIEAGTSRDLSTGAREAHGDRVIALAGALMMCSEAPTGEAVKGDDGLPRFTMGSLLKHGEVIE